MENLLNGILSWSTLVVGGLMIAAPPVAAKLLKLPPRPNLNFAIRALGSRDVVLALGLLRSEVGSSDWRMLVAGTTLVHAIDVGSAVWSWREGSLSAEAARSTATVDVGLVGMGLWLLRG